MRLSALLFPALLAAGCSTLGDRASTGECPEGESCSDLTPLGLTFDGAAFSDVLFNGGLHPTAVGGVQTITINDVAIHAPLTQDFQTDTRGAALRVVDTFGARVQVEGRSPGQTLLRVIDPRTYQLYDRVDVSAAAIARLELHPLVFDEVVLADTPIAMWLGSRRDLVVALFDAGNNRLVDERMTLAGGEQIAWDLVRVRASGTFVTLGVAAGRNPSAPLSVPVVEAVDRIVPTEPADAPPRTTVLRSSDLVCFAGLRGAEQVLGAPWAFTVDGPATFQSGTSFPNCMAFESNAIGTLTITARLGAVSATRTIEVVASAKLNAGAATPVTAPTGPSLGERAAVLDAVDAVDALD